MADNENSPTKLGSTRWTPSEERMEELRQMGWVRPELLFERGGSTCAKCDGKTRSVLDGEAWCDECGRHQ